MGSQAKGRYTDDGGASVEEEEEGDREGGLGMRSKGGGAKREGWEGDNAAVDDVKSWPHPCMHRHNHASMHSTQHEHRHDMATAPQQPHEECLGAIPRTDS